MTLELKSFGTFLNSRPSGSEAFKAFQTTLRDLKSDENLVIDFSGVHTFTPSWGDEFLGSLLDQLGDRLVLLPSDNLSVQVTLKLLQEIKGKTFVIHAE